MRRLSVPAAWRVALGALLLLAGPIVLGAQRVRGEVLQENGTSPALGVAVVASRADGSVAGRALTGFNGVFEMKLAAGGLYTFSALRIGYRPTLVSDVAVPDTGAVAVRVVLAGVAVPLAAVDVRGTDVCGTARDPQAQIVQVWTAARTALAAAALWSREPLDAEWITFRRELAVGTEFVRAQEVRTSRNATVHAFKSWYAESLAVHGYMINADAGATYYAPDPDVLLSDSFAETHCFHLEPAPADDRGLVGLGFSPQRGRGDRVEIEGTLWIDRASSELRWLEYRYVGLPDAAESGSPGGRVEFVHLTDGPWMIGRWHIRMPIIGATSPAAEKGYARTVVKSGGPVLNGLSIGGGMVSRVLRRGQLLYEATGSGIALQLLRGDGEVSVANARVTLEGTDYAWRTDSAGLLRAAPVLEGRYRARIATPEMLALGAEPMERTVQIAVRRTGIDSATVPSARDVVRDACGADAVKGGLAALHGTVRDSAGRAAAGRAVTVSWLGTVLKTDRAVVFAGRNTVGTMSDNAGVWRLCDVPRERTLTVRASGDDGNAVTEVTVPDGRWLHPVTLRLGRGAAGAVDSTAASLELLTKDAAGTALGATTLELTAVGGAQRKVTTDAQGRALVAAFPPGMVKLRAKRPGYESGDVLFTALAGRNTVPVILGQATLPMLDTVRVAGNRRTSSRMDAFETRRARREATASYNAADIGKRNPSELADLLRGVAGVRLADSAGVTVALLARGFKLDRDANAQPCVMKVLLDGVLMPMQAGVNVARPTELLGLEVFASTARTPAGLGLLATDAACGVIAVYTGKD
ncbi:MAG: hypothetical protein P3B98_12405 [Gemmatimonadota bacterium]|nr:hypothetical protein [Gemmatimonadota bacterium]